MVDAGSRRAKASSKGDAFKTSSEFEAVARSFSARIVKLYAAERKGSAAEPLDRDRIALPVLFANMNLRPGGRRELPTLGQLHQPVGSGRHETHHAILSESFIGEDAWAGS